VNFSKTLHKLVKFTQVIKQKTLAKTFPNFCGKKCFFNKVIHKSQAKTALEPRVLFGHIGDEISKNRRKKYTGLLSRGA
jgi:hypothetical protein